MSEPNLDKQLAPERLIEPDNERMHGLQCLFCPSTQMALYWLPDSDPKVCHLYCCRCGATGPWAEFSTEAVELHARVSGDVAPRSVANFEAWTTIDKWLRDNPKATATECLVELTKRIKIESGDVGTREDVISLAAAKAAICFMCAKPERYKAAEAIEGSERLFHFQIEKDSREDAWNAGACLANALNKVPAVAGPTEEAGKCKRAWPCRYRDPRQCAHDTKLGSECPTVCECKCHTAGPTPSTRPDIGDLYGVGGEIYTFIDTMLPDLQMRERLGMAKRARELKAKIAEHANQVEIIAKRITEECKDELAREVAPSSIREAGDGDV